MGRLGASQAQLLEELTATDVSKHWSREQRLHLASVLLARADAGLDKVSVSPDRVGVFDGTSRGNLEWLCDRLEERRRGKAFVRHDLAVGPLGQAAALTAIHLGIRGPACTYLATCASGAVAVGQAMHALQRGEIDVAFATGHDTPLIAPVYEPYRTAGILCVEAEDASRALRPFVDASGTVFAEGAVTLVLESRAHAQARGVPGLAAVAQFAHGNAGVHATNVDATGDVPARLLARLLARAGSSPAEIDFVIGHGNGVAITYSSEIGYMKRVFGERAAEVPLLSTKPIFGHMMAAASALDAAAAVLAVHHGRSFSTINVDPRRVPDGVRHHGIEPTSRCRRGLAVSYGMGGQITALLIEGLGVTPEEKNR
jgi:3-oxoacyl-[acyl-carrier-protein] synthase II